MSNRTAWFLNIGLLALVLIYLFVGLYTHNWWMDITVVGVYVLGAAVYFVVQMIRHRGGTELNRAQWLWGPGWWRRFATDGFQPRKPRGAENTSFSKNERSSSMSRTYPFCLCSEIGTWD